MKSRKPCDVVKRILVVDDEKSIQFLLSRLLEATGFDVNIAENGIQGWELFIENAYDLVITDFQMPGLDGLRLAESIKRRCPTVPVILISGSDLDQIRSSNGYQNFDRLVAKPFKIAEMRDLVLQTLNTLCSAKTEQ